MYRDRFGYLLEPLRFRSARVALSPTLWYSDAVRQVKARTCDDGFVYPDRFRGDPNDPKGIPPAPQNLHRLPPSHRLVLLDEPQDEKAVRLGTAGFIIHLLGMLHGVRCQFCGWWFDGRISLKEIPVGVATRDLPQLVDGAVAVWRAWGTQAQRVMINALYLLGRAPGYAWNWERFQAEYQVFDALYAVARDCHGVEAGRRVRHRERFEAMHDHFDIAYDKSYVEEMVRARNALVHEALWADGMPNRDATEVFHLAYWLHRLNVRLALAVLEVRADYVASPWWQMGTHPFVLR